MKYIGLLPLVLLHAFTVTQTFIIAWGYSVTGYKTIQKFFGKDWDHTGWNIERGFVVVGFGLSLIFGALIGEIVKTSWVALINTISWWFCFPLIQQYVHNWTLNWMEVNGYELNIKESPNGTARTQSKPWVKITLAIIGVVAPIAYYLL